MPQRDEAPTIVTHPAPSPAPAAPRRPSPRPWPAPQALDDAVRVVTDTRCHGPAPTRTELVALQRADPYRFVEMTLALAALVPAEQPVAQLLAWTTEVPA
jgi:hypothetical protein